MSKDFTPEQLYQVEQHLFLKEGTWFDFMKGLTVSINGVERSVYTEEEIELCQRFLYLGRLMDNFVEYHQELMEYDDGERILQKYEEELSTYISNKEGDKSSVVIRWYHGLLDKNFYYRERNTELLISAIKAECLREA